MAVVFAAIGFVFVEVYLTRYGVHVINIDVRYLVIISAIGLLVFAVTAIVVFIIFFLLAGPLVASVPALIIGLILGVIVGVPLAAPPTDVVLILKDPITISGLPLTMDAANPKRSQTVTKLIDLTDGILVQDKHTGAVVSVKSDMLNGVIEAMPALATSPAAPTPTP